MKENNKNEKMDLRLANLCNFKDLYGNNNVVVGNIQDSRIFQSELNPFKVAKQWLLFILAEVNSGRL